MLVGDAVDDRQAEPRTRTDSSGVGLPESIEGVCDACRVETVAVVAHADNSRVILESSGHLDGGACRRVAHRVRHEVGHGLAKMVTVALDDNGFRGIQRDGPINGNRPRITTRVGGQHGKVDRGALGARG